MVAPPRSSLALPKNLDLRISLRNRGCSHFVDHGGESTIVYLGRQTTIWGRLRLCAVVGNDPGPNHLDGWGDPSVDRKRRGRQLPTAFLLWGASVVRPTAQTLEGPVQNHRKPRKLGDPPDSPRTGGGERERRLRVAGGVGRIT